MNEIAYTKGSKTSPAQFTIQVGNVQCLLTRVEFEGELYWVGRPVNDRGQWCQFVLVIKSTGRILGGGPVNFFALGGWSPGQHNHVPQDQRDMVRDEIVAKFKHNVTAFCGDDKARLISEDVRAELVATVPRGIMVVDGEESTNEELLALAGVGAQAMAIAKENGFGLILSVEQHFGRALNPKFCAVEDGEWDGASGLLALSTGLSLADIVLLKKCGKRIAQVPMRKAA